MNSNDTSTHLRRYRRGKAWRATFHRNYKRYRPTYFSMKDLIVTLWNLTKKYESAMRHREVVPIKEAEIDRGEVADSYCIIETPWERGLDGRFYHTLAAMQHQRDSQLATPDISPQEWIRYFATEVKRRATPILFVVSPEKSIPALGLPPEDSPVAHADPPTSDDRQAMRKHQIPYEEFSYQSLEDCRSGLIQRLQGKRIPYTDLAEHLTNWELDLLSQMIRDNAISTTFEKTSIKFHNDLRSSPFDSDFVAVAIAAKNYEEVAKQ